MIASEVIVPDGHAAKPPRRTRSVAMGILCLRDALVINRDLYRQCVHARDFKAPADRSLALRALDRERVELNNALILLLAEERDHGR